MAATSYEAAACRKKGAVNTPSEIQIFENGSGGFDLSQNRRMASFGPQNTICHNCGFFYNRKAALLLHFRSIQLVVTRHTPLEN